MTKEIELKYQLDADTAQKLLAQRHLGGFALGPFVVTEVDDVYYDTRDRHLARAGYALRFRRRGEKRELQMKSLTPASGPRHIRHEIRIPTDTPTQPDHWPNTPETTLLRDILDGQLPQPLFSIHQIRHEAPVLDPSGRPFALLSLDQVRWEANGKEARAWEMEVELLPDREESALNALQQALSTLPGLNPQAQSKYEQGMQLLAGAGPQEERQ